MSNHVRSVRFKHQPRKKEMNHCQFQNIRNKANFKQLTVRRRNTVTCIGALPFFCLWSQWNGMDWLEHINKTKRLTLCVLTYLHSCLIHTASLSDSDQWLLPAAWRSGMSARLWSLMQMYSDTRQWTEVIVIQHDTAWCINVWCHLYPSRHEPLDLFLWATHSQRPRQVNLHPNDEIKVQKMLFLLLHRHKPQWKKRVMEILASQLFMHSLVTHNSTATPFCNSNLHCKAQLTHYIF